MERVCMMVTTTHPGRIARLGETIGFFAGVATEGPCRKVFDAEIRWTLVRNSSETVCSGSYRSSSYSGGVRVLADRPGALRVTFEAYRESGKVASAEIGVVIEAEAIRPTVPVPEDFGDFWSSQLSELSEGQVTWSLTPLEEHDGVTVSDLQAPCAGGAPVSGIFACPSSVSAGKHPAILMLQGAGVRSGAPGMDTALWATRGFLALDINAHGLENGREPAWYESLANGSLSGYPTRGFETGDRSVPYVRGMFLRVVRALEVLSAMPSWDGKNLWVTGGSQGAWQSLCGAALMPRVSGAAVSCPAGCDMAGGGWPFAHLIGAPVSEALRRTLPYYDGCSFCSQIPAIPVYFSVGLVDRTCKPDGILAAYNSLRTGDRTLSLHQQTGHETPFAVKAEMDRFILSRLR